MNRILFPVMGLFLFGSALCFAQADLNWERRYDCHVKTGSIVVNGVADEIAWQLAPELGPFTRFQKKGVLEVTHRTTAKMLWDEDNLYILVAVEDPDIWSTMTVDDKDCLCSEETIEVFIDPDGDGFDYAELHFNCLNTRNDIWIPQKTFKYRDGKPVDWLELYKWNAEKMQYAVMNYGSVNDKTDRDLGSVFEIAIPWKGLGKIAGSAKLPPKSGDIWRINVNRYEVTRGEKNERTEMELSGWAPLDLNTYHLPERYGFVKFVDKQ
ncbi:MAG: carbohydrate-binding family 9-like protein [Candidatus Latescibacterota bacterium]